jgi:hypothetical protein
MSNSPQNSTKRRVRVPQHVVFKSFVNETVVLNLETGVYHGLNLTGGRMLQELDDSGDFEETVAKLAEAFQQPADRVRGDLDAFCRHLDERGLVELEGWD